MITPGRVHLKYTWCTLHVNDNSITVSYRSTVFIAENSNLDCIRTILITFDLLLRHLMLFFLPQTSDAEHDEVWLSFQSEPAQNYIQVRIVRGDFASIEKSPRNLRSILLQNEVRFRSPCTCKYDPKSGHMNITYFNNGLILMSMTHDWWWHAKCMLALSLWAWHMNDNDMLSACWPYPYEHDTWLMMTC